VGAKRSDDVGDEHRDTTLPRELTRIEYEAELASAPPVVRLAYRGELQVASEALAGERTPEAVAQLFLGTALRVEDALARFELPVACRSGCSRCCHGTKVNVSVPEALAIADVLCNAAGPDSADLETRVTAAALEMRELDIGERWRKQVPCAFLDAESGHCSIYPVRPLACRQHHSVDVFECERAAADPSGESRVHTRALIDAIWGAARSAVRYACQDAGLDDRPFELTNAVAFAMKSREARERWTRGERVFDEARIPSDDADAWFAASALAQMSELIPEQRLMRRATTAERNKRKRERKARK
jgi:Fe-S-cluster containining protein